MTAIKKIGFGGGCHWCTEAVFQSLKGVQQVEQGWIASTGTNYTFSEAVIVHFDPTKIDLDVLTQIHLYTHSCTSQHTMRNKYRSAVYTFKVEQEKQASKVIETMQSQFDKPIITQVLPFMDFKLNEEKYQDYYQKNRENQFCQTYINPKFRILMQRFSGQVDRSRVGGVD